MAGVALALLSDPARAAALAAAGRAPRAGPGSPWVTVCAQLAKEYRALIAATAAGHDDDE
jgi:hypothetical protein